LWRHDAWGTGHNLGLRNNGRARGASGEREKGLVFRIDFIGEWGLVGGGRNPRCLKRGLYAMGRPQAAQLEWGGDPTKKIWGKD